MDGDLPAFPDHPPVPDRSSHRGGDRTITEKKGETRTEGNPSGFEVAGLPAESRRGETYFPFFFFEPFFAFVFFGMFSTSGCWARSRERIGLPRINTPRSTALERAPAPVTDARKVRSSWVREVLPSKRNKAMHAADTAEEGPAISGPWVWTAYRAYNELLRQKIQQRFQEKEGPWMDQLAEVLADLVEARWEGGRQGTKRERELALRLRGLLEESP
jgi:hypothetical protein